MNAQEARRLGDRLAGLAAAGQADAAHALLAPILAERTPFRLLDHVGAEVGAGPPPEMNAFLDRIASGGTMGGWVVIASALGRQLDRGMPGVLARCRGFVIAADVWYGTDILGERVPGPALVAHLNPALALLTPWRDDANRWVRRTVGVAAHFWAKRSRGKPELEARARELLAFLEPMFEERDSDAVKGVGWGLKTLGRTYPDLLTEWLREQIVDRQRRPRALMLRKARTYLPSGMA